MTVPLSLYKTLNDYEPCEKLHEVLMYYVLLETTLLDLCNSFIGEKNTPQSIEMKAVFSHNCPQIYYDSLPPPNFPYSVLTRFHSFTAFFSY